MNLSAGQTPRLWLLLCLGVWSSGLFQVIYSQDIFHHLALGEDWVRHGWAAGPGSLGVGLENALQSPSSWFFQVLAYWIHAWASWNGLILFKIIVAGLCLVVFWRGAEQRGVGASPLAFLAGLLLLSTFSEWLESPRSFTFLAFALGIFFWRATGWRQVLGLFGVGVFWANTHDSVVYFVALSLFALGLRIRSGQLPWREAWLASVAMLVGSFLRPWPLDAWISAYQRFIVHGGFHSMIAAWQPVNLTTHPWYFVLSGIFLIFTPRFWRSEKFGHWILAWLLFIVALCSRNAAPYAALLMANELAPALMSWARGLSLKWLRLAALLTLSLPLLGLRGDPGAWRGGFFKEKFPVGAAKFLIAYPSDSALACVSWHGDYLIWALKGKPRVFFDNRRGLSYPSQHLYQQARLFAASPEWPDIARAHRLELFLVPLKPEPQPLAVVLAQDINYVPVYFDEGSILYASRGILAQHPDWPVYEGLDPIQGRVTEVTRKTLLALTWRRRHQLEDALGHYLTALVLLKLGDVPAARREAELALAQAPEQPGPKQLLKLLSQRNQP